MAFGDTNKGGGLSPGFGNGGESNAAIKGGGPNGSGALAGGGSVLDGVGQDKYEKSKSFNLEKNGGYADGGSSGGEESVAGGAGEAGDPKVAENVKTFLKPGQILPQLAEDKFKRGILAYVSVLQSICRGPNSKDVSICGSRRRTTTPGMSAKPRQDLKEVLLSSLQSSRE